MNRVGSDLQADIFGVVRRYLTLLIMALCFWSGSPAPADASLLVLQVGVEGPDFVLNTLEGKNKKSSELQGEGLTALVFWSTSVKKSEALLTKMQQLYSRFRSSGFSVIAVNVDEQKAGPRTLQAVGKTRDRLKLDFPMLLDPGLAAFSDYGVIALPTTVIVDKQRVVKYELSGYPLVGADALEEFVVSSIAGPSSQKHVAHPAYLPDKTAVRFYGMGIRSLKSKVLASQAENWFRKAVDADPNFMLPRLGLGKLYKDRGDMARAEAEYRAVLAKEPKHPVATCEVALVLVERGRNTDALAMLEDARKSHEAYSPCYYYMGYALGRERRLPEAEAMFREAEALNPSDYRTYVYQGKLFEYLKDTKKAADSYARALDRIVHGK
ncbi:redoxin domain-containing protein [Geomonas sp. Red69]|uniref:redoxin domain-containing protein n=1 Tax=Geomonas diazotrophica TaxID=2843197 RepID=UPI001C0FB941|nr:redoxin domain-containing protein [Geomonas diazotrophica]MBU5637934.1 redoxin domain-containing protein [Geomonas diazotrophica]